MVTGEQSEAVEAMLKRFAAIRESQEAGLREMEVASPPTAIRYGDYLVQSLIDDIELFRLAQAAANTWRPDAPPADLPGGRSYLVAMSRAVETVEASDPAGEFLALRERIEVSARRWATVSAVEEEHEAVFARMSADMDELNRVLGPVRAAVNDYVSFLEEENVSDLIRGFQEAARSTPGIRGRITEQVVGPAGDVTVVRDDAVEGPPDDPPDTVITPAEHTALGLEDVDMKAAWPGFVAAQMRATLRDLRLSDSSPRVQVRAEFLKRAGNSVETDLMIAEELRSTPASLRNLRPGDIFGLRGQLVFASLEPLLNVSGVPNPSPLPIVIARQFATAAPFFIERASIDRAAPGNASDLRLPAPQCFVFHDAVPLPSFPDVDDLPAVFGWVVFADDDLRPLPICLCVIGYPAETGEEAAGSRAVLAATSGPIVADLVSRIMHLLADTRLTG